CALPICIVFFGRPLNRLIQLLRSAVLLQTVRARHGIEVQVWLYLGYDIPMPRKNEVAVRIESLNVAATQLRARHVECCDFTDVFAQTFIATEEECAILGNGTAQRASKLIALEFRLLPAVLVVFPTR